MSAPGLRGRSDPGISRSRESGAPGSGRERDPGWRREGRGRALGEGAGGGAVARR